MGVLTDLVLIPRKGADRVESARADLCELWLRELQRASEAYSRGHPEEPIRIRIGLHCGEAIRDEDKFFGKTVIHAFRIADLAARDEILVSGHLRSLVEGRGLAFRNEREVTLKGFSGVHPIVCVEW